MTSEQIEKFITQLKRKNEQVQIHFKDRQPVTGMFITGSDYSELKSKNLWRIVSSMNLKEWSSRNDINLSRIFNGISFTRLSDDNE
ncbi:MAG: short-chain dehydrogenase [Chitinophagaceae bacterium]|nr:short-chain dehydrogenase [Chitinophagaceae bacterium]MBK8953415.1 short-chain dehydrogenase [Chitinophagaceae bacterium]